MTIDEIPPAPPGGSLRHTMRFLFRASCVIIGLALAYSRLTATSDGQFAGFYLPITGEALGRDIASILIYCFAGWLIDRGIHGKRSYKLIKQKGTGQ
jgi:hypothetical protein